MKRTKIGAAIILGVLATSAMAWANGGGGGDSSVTSQTDLYRQAKKLIDRERYADAIPLLKRSINQKGEYADALNLLGYSNRKLGNADQAMAYYTKALTLEPNHLGANEYLGELYLELDNLPKAEERLAVLKNACDDCEEYEDLEEEIADYKEAHGVS
jgi:tetratricopeptide (TPR) repeat protein